jgi:hypothetical protein
MITPSTKEFQSSCCMAALRLRSDGNWLAFPLSSGTQR